jgi:phage tail sheath protein FI
MAVSVSFPGVYVEEISSGVRTIVGVSTARTAFVGSALKGPVNEATLIFSFADFERTFGGLWAKSTMSFAVQQYFANGGGEALIVRVKQTGATTASIDLPGTPGPKYQFSAASPGLWGERLSLLVDHLTRDAPNLALANITVLLDDVEVEVLRNVVVPDVRRTLEQRSAFIRFTDTNTPATLAASAVPPPLAQHMTNGLDGTVALDSDDLIGSASARTGMNALATVDIFNILCLPPHEFGDHITNTNYQAAAAFCAQHRAILLVDPPSDATDPTAAVAAFPSTAVSPFKKNAAAFYPFLLAPNPLSGVIEPFVPCGAVAGVFARTDAQRGVWKAPAGIDAGISGIVGFSQTLTDPENGVLNKEAVNCLRTFPTYGNVVWGSRTLDGADAIGSEWKYIPVRRLALFIEESLFRGLKWVVFEPNDEPLWSQIRLNVGAFMNNLFRQGAFQGASPKDAYFVKCDSSTTTQNDINLGIVNILVGFAPLKPAEFVILKLQQIAGQIQV